MKIFSWRLAPRCDGPAASSTALRPRIAVMVTALALPIVVGALPSEVNNFWDTTEYVNASPNRAVSSLSGLTSFTTNKQESNTLDDKFRSNPPKGTILLMR